MRLCARHAYVFLAFAVCAAASAAAQDVAAAPEYREIAAQLSSRIEHEMADKHLPAISIALIDDQKVVWAQGFGYEDAAKTQPATAHTIYRVGSISKLFTDIAVMQLVERGQLDLDAPITQYLPSFAPKNGFGGKITLRQLMSHRSGLVREPPVGNYFDASSPSLEATVNSLNETALVAAPGTLTKYSNAGVATVGYTLQQTVRQPYAAYMKSTLLEPLGMHESAFTPEPELTKHLASAWMWSYDGLNFPAPTFQLGEAPAGALYSTVLDLGKFLSVLFADGRTASGEMLRPATLHSMLEPQFGEGSPSAAFGIGFRLSTLDGEREIGHNGAIYGYASQLSALPESKLGVVVITTVDSANAVTAHIGEDALRLMLASRKRQPLTLPPFATDLPSGLGRKLAGDYEAAAGKFHLDEQNGSLFLLPLQGGMFARLRSAGGGLIQDSRISYSPLPILPQFDAAGQPSLTIKDESYRHLPDTMPKPASDTRMQLIGEYGWDYDKLYVLESHGSLWILVEWFDFEPLTPVDGDIYRLPSHGLYVNETLKFLRDKDQKITGLQLGGVTFPRLPESPAGSVFQITPLKPVAVLRQEALAATPPQESGTFLKPDLVELTALDPTIHLDIRYATDRNFLGTPVYLQARAFMQRPAAEAVARASHRLHELGYGLLIHDSYRPWYVTKMFWEGTPDDKRIFVANPSEGSRHNRGCAVDLTLYDLKSGKPIQMTGGYDEMSERSYPFYPGGTALERWHRDLLRRVMEDEGFTVYEYEWWHFDYRDWRKYPILNLTFEQLDQQAQRVTATKQN